MPAKKSNSSTPHRSFPVRRSLNPTARPLPAATGERKKAGRTRATILLIDDDAAVREGLRRVLQTEGWEVMAAASGEEALEYLQAHQPDLMITDLSMAAVSGWDLLFHELLERPALPIFVITALPLPLAGDAAAFAHEFFQKPLEFDALLAATRRHLAATING